jgi:hypothetical protein
MVHNVSLCSKVRILTFIHCPAISDINSGWFRGVTNLNVIMESLVEKQFMITPPDL